jgi:hypothetical protein
MEKSPSLHSIANDCYKNAQEIDAIAFGIEKKLINIIQLNKDRKLKSEPDILEAKLLALDTLLLDTKTLLKELYERI